LIQRSSKIKSVMSVWEILLIAQLTSKIVSCN